MKKIFVYYSDSGNGDYVKEILKNKGFETLKIIPEKELPNSFFFKILTGGFSAMRKEKAKIKNDLNGLREYDEIYVGTPIWNNRISSPINTVIDYIKDKKFNVICYSGSGKVKGIVKQLKDYNTGVIISLIEPLKNREDSIKELEKYL